MIKFAARGRYESINNVPVVAVGQINTVTSHDETTSRNRLAFELYIALESFYAFFKNILSLLCQRETGRGRAREITNQLRIYLSSSISLSIFIANIYSVSALFIRSALTKVRASIWLVLEISLYSWNRGFSHQWL